MNTALEIRTIARMKFCIEKKKQLVRSFINKIIYATGIDTFHNFQDKVQNSPIGCSHSNMIALFSILLLLLLQVKTCSRNLILSLEKLFECIQTLDGNLFFFCKLYVNTFKFLLNRLFNIIHT